MARLTWDEYFMSLAETAAERADCSRRRVGAVLVRGVSVISTGYNGTPRGAPNCTEGGCPRCAGTAPSGTAYGECLCVHAEENAVAFAARNGGRTGGARLYTTLHPCLWCAKLLIQAGVRDVIFRDMPESGTTYPLVESGLIEYSSLAAVRELVLLCGPVARSWHEEESAL